MKALALLFAALLVAGCGSQPAAPAAAETEARTPPEAEVSFAKEILPILAQSGVPCHSGQPDAKSAYGLTSYEGVMGAGKDTRPNVVPGNADSSLLYQMLKTGKMPPAGPLAPDKVELVRKWIAQGAKNN